MAYTVNINTATMEQLKTIKNIGQIRVSLILASREKKGQLNLTDLKLIEGIPNTVWDTLVESGKITIEPPEHKENVTDPHRRIADLEEQMSRMNEIMKQRSQEKQTVVYALQEQIQQMQLEFQSKFQEQELRFKAQLDKILLDNKLMEDTVLLDYQRIEAQLKQEIKLRDNQIKQMDDIRSTTEKI